MDEERAVIGQKKAIIDQLIQGPVISQLQYRGLGLLNGHWPGEDVCMPGYDLSPQKPHQPGMDHGTAVNYNLLVDTSTFLTLTTGIPNCYNRGGYGFMAVIYRQKVQIFDTFGYFGYSKFWILCRNLGGQYPSIYDHPPTFQQRLFTFQLMYNPLAQPYLQPFVRHGSQVPLQDYQPSLQPCFVYYTQS